ncbi:MAG: LytR C-terminal domain-containing protein [Microbacteriaceae bacterium]|nr:LytR C-terminal domain-containing protein [Microbacteriaceae bacterium]
MPKVEFPEDRFNIESAPNGRVGAHRATKTGFAKFKGLFWSALSVVAIVGIGVGALWLQDQGIIEGIPIGPGEQTQEPIEPEVVLPDPIQGKGMIRVLDADLSQEGLAISVRGALIAAGWNVVTISDAAEGGFENTVVFYSDADYEAEAYGLAQALGGVPVQFSEAYLGIPLTAVLGADWFDEPTIDPSVEVTPTPTAET